MAATEDLSGVLHQTHTRLLRYAATIVGPDSADDILSKVTLRLLERQPVDVANAVAYLYRMVLNEALSYQRSVGRRRERIGRYLRLEARDPHHHDQTRDYEVEKALGSLSPQQRAVIHLAYWEDLEPVVIADLLEVSEGTVRKQLARARAKLRSELHHE